MMKRLTFFLLLTLLFSAAKAETQSTTWSSSTSTQSNQADIYWVGVQTPSGSANYTLNEFKLYLNTGEKASTSYMIISKSNSSVTSVNSNDVVAISTNAPAPAASYVTYSFSNATLSPGTTYYLYFVTSNATATTYSTTTQRIAFASATSYSPGIMSSDKSTKWTNYQPIYTATLTYEGTGSGTETTTTKLAKYLSSKYGETWVRLLNANSTNYYASYYAQITGADAYNCNAATISSDADASSWCIVGTADKCLLYNKKMGSDYALGTASTSYGDGIYANLYPASSSNVCYWHIVDYTSMTKGGYAFLPYGNDTWAINMYGGASDATRYLRLYNNVGTDTGDNWNFSLVPTPTIGNEDNVDNVSNIVFKNSGSTVPYRIPAITRAFNGDLIALADYRYCGSDIGGGHIDVVGKISKDNGGSWGDQFTVQAGDNDPSSNTCGYGDAAIVADRTSSRVLVMSCSAAKNAGYGSGNLQAVRYYSEDNGATWGASVNITSTIKSLIGVSNFFVGSGKLCQSRQIKAGTYYRVYAPLCTPSGNFVLYSDDFGETWSKLGGLCVSGGNEPKCEELPNGNVLISSRTSSGRYYNIYTYTDKTAATGSWGTVATWNETINDLKASSDACNGEILIVNAIRKSDNTPVTLALQSVPTGSSRANVTIFYKELASTSDYDTPAHFATGWDGCYQVSYTSSAYSTMCIQADNRIGFFFEETLSNNGYNLIYYRYPLETITNNAYSLVYNIPDAQTYNVSTHKIVADKVTYSRTNITNQGTYTVCLPFSLTAEQASTYGITKIEKMTAADQTAGTVTFTDVTSNGITAYTPYVVTCNAGALQNVALTNQTIDELPTTCATTFDGVSFTGNFIYDKDMTGYYGFKADGSGFIKGISGAFINAFRAYLNAPIASVKAFTMNHLDTGITSVEAPTAPVNVYTADGKLVRANTPLNQALSGLQKGLYIVNHKKVVID
jgi:hypothetical protein